MTYFVEKIKTVRTIIVAWRDQSLDRKMVVAILSVALFTAAAKLAFLGKELIVAWKFGAAGDLDAFLMAYAVPSFIINLAASSMSAAFIPVYIQVRTVASGQEAQRLYESSISFSVFLLAFCAGIVALSARYFLSILASGFDSEKINLTLKLLYLISPVIVFSGVAAIRGAVLNAGEKFAAPALIPAVTPLMTILFITAAGNLLGIYALAIGLVAGQFVEMHLLGRALNKQGIQNILRWHGVDSNLRRVIEQIIPMLAGALLLGTSPLVDQYFAATLPDGSVSLLNYGNKIISFPMHIAAIALGTSALPYFSSILSRNDWHAARRLLIRYLKLVFWVSVPLTVALAVFSQPIVRTLLQRGAFTEQDTQGVARVLAFGVLQIPFYLGAILITRLISAAKSNQVLTKIAFVNMIVNIFADYWLAKYYGAAGVSLATTIVTCFSFLMLLFSVVWMIRGTQTQ